MKSCEELFKEITGITLAKKSTDYRSREPIDESIFGTVSKMFLDKRQDFYSFKEKLENVPEKSKNCLFFSTLGYFYYVDCDFKKAIQCFKKAIDINPVDLEIWFSLAFCYRQTGKERLFDSIIFNYDCIISEFMEKKKGIDQIIAKHGISGE